MSIPVTLIWPFGHSSHTNADDQKVSRMTIKNKAKSKCLQRLIKLQDQMSKQDRPRWKHSSAKQINYSGVILQVARSSNRLWMRTHAHAHLNLTMRPSISGNHIKGRLTMVEEDNPTFNFTMQIHDKILLLSPAKAVFNQNFQQSDSWPTGYLNLLLLME